jgi:predicted lysophospholipase L1 biosynthesis ABC-type transport system permease subunit
MLAKLGVDTGGGQRLANSSWLTASCWLTAAMLADSLVLADGRNVQAAATLRHMPVRLAVQHLRRHRVPSILQWLFDGTHDRGEPQQTQHILQ